MRKEKQAIEIYKGIIKEMGSFVRSNGEINTDFEKVKVPLWLK